MSESGDGVSVACTRQKAVSDAKACFAAALLPLAGAKAPGATAAAALIVTFGCRLSMS